MRIGWADSEATGRHGRIDTIQKKKTDRLTAVKGDLMPSDQEKARILAGRRFLRYEDDGEDHDQSDQQLKLPQPPLVKAPMTPVAIDLPKNYRDLGLNNDILDILFRRESHRVFTDQPMTLLTLAYLLWATQGIRASAGRITPPSGRFHAAVPVMSLKPIFSSAMSKDWLQAAIITCR